MTEHDPKLNILAPVETRPRLDRLEQARAPLRRRRMTRAEALGLGGLALLAAAGCGGKTSTGGSVADGASNSGAADPLARKADGEQPRHLQLVAVRRPQHVQELQDPRPRRHQGEVLLVQRRAAGQLQAGGTGYDIIEPSQTAVGELVQLGSLMKLDKALIPNAAAVESSWVRRRTTRPGDYKVVKDFGVTMFFYNNKIVTEKPTTMKQFYDLLPKYGKVGRTNLMDGAGGGGAAGAMALGYDPNTGDSAELDKAKNLPALDPQRGHHDRLVQVLNDASDRQDHPRQGWNGDVRRSVSARKSRATSPPCAQDTSEKWADNWCIPATAPDPVAAHASINHLCDPAVAVKEMEYHS